ncbi:MAG: hypothetical protein HZA19_05370 [Nitrospirae bacterium]|nr:hypothetical protein [Nitrospirota bacterium]
MNTVDAFDLAIQIEQKVSRLYERFSALFRGNQMASRFWSTIAYHEKDHAENLMRSKGSFLGLHRGQPDNGKVPAVLNSKDLEAIFQKIREQEKKVKKERPTLQQAVAMMLEIENGEIHHIYNALIRLAGRKKGKESLISSDAAMEHARVIKDFLHHTPVGGQLTLQGSDLPKQIIVPKKPVEPEVSTPSKGPSAGRRRGRIIDITPEMRHGLIAGEDGRQYLFLIGEEGIQDGSSLATGISVSFCWQEYPWGPRAYQIKMVKS